MSLVLPLPQPPPHSPPHMPLSRPHTPTTPRTSPSPRHSRPSTPPSLGMGSMHASALSALQPISAPPTPVTTTHVLHSEPSASRMERCRSSEAAIGILPLLPLSREQSRESRKRDVKSTGLLFKTSTSSSREHVRDAADKGEWAHIESANPTSLTGSAHPSHPPSQLGEGDGHIPAAEEDEDHKMDIDEVAQPAPLSEEAVAEKMALMEEEAPQVWGMPKWGWEQARDEIRPGVRLVGMEELPALIERHNMLDVPSHVLFPWLHGIADDGQRGRDMAAFFGHAPPFEPPSYRGLCLLLAPNHPLDSQPLRAPAKTPTQSPSQPTAFTPVLRKAPSMSQNSNGRDSYDARERSETMSTSSESFVSSNETDITSPSLSDSQPKTPSTPERAYRGPEPEVVVTEDDVQMHPCESMRVSPKAQAAGLAEEHHPLPCDTPAVSQTLDSDSSDSSEDSDEQPPSCILLNALHAQDIFDFPKFSSKAYQPGSAHFRLPRLPQQINLRNLNIQQIKYATISDIVLYAKGGVGSGVAQIAQMIAESQEELYQARMAEYYSLHQDRGRGEGISEPVRYGVWIVVEPFSQVEKLMPQSVNIDSKGSVTANSALTDLFEREAKESRLMTGATEVVEGFWVGNDCDVPGGADDGAGSRMSFDLCVRASEMFEMPSASALTQTYRKLVDLDKRRKAEAAAEASQSQQQQQQASSAYSWVASPATMALRNLLSPSSTPLALSESSSGSASAKRIASPSRDESTPTKTRRASASKSAPELHQAEFISLDCSGSCRSITGQMRSLTLMTDRVVELVYFLRKIVEGRDKTGVKRRVLVHCQDGYTESSIIVLAYVMSSLSCSLPEAYLHLQLAGKRSFFLYPSDKPLLRRVDSRLMQDRKTQALQLVSNASSAVSGSGNGSASGTSSPTNPGSPLSSRWKAWGFGSKETATANGSSTTNTTTGAAVSTPDKKAAQRATVDHAREMLLAEEKGGSKERQEAKVWFNDHRFDGFPSRILDFLYLGNLEHAGNAGMLKSIGITHVVSVGESLISCPPDCDPMYGQIGSNTLCAEHRAGNIQVLDLADIRDDGNDPLRPLIAKAVQWIEEARASGGIILVHCRVGVSRSASIVMAYMMQHKRMGLMDAYLLTRARRLNVLIQPNLRFFHELFGWEVEIAKEEKRVLQAKKDELQQRGGQDIALIREIKEMEDNERQILYSWPSFCRDLHCLNRRFLCN